MSRLLNVFRESAVWRASLWKRCALRLHREREEALGRAAAAEARIGTLRQLAAQRQEEFVAALNEKARGSSEAIRRLSLGVEVEHRRAERFKRAVRGLVRRLLSAQAELSDLAASKVAVLELRPGDRLMLLHPGRLKADACANLRRAFDSWYSPLRHPVAVLEEGVRPIVVRTAEPAEPHSQAR